MRPVFVDFGIKAIDLSDQEVKRLEKLMSETFFATHHCALERYKFGDVKLLRNEWKSGKLNLWENPRARRLLTEMAKEEETIIAGFIRLGSSRCAACNSFERPGVTMEDYYQECVMSLYDSMYTYNGQDRFSTYATFCMQNRLINFTRAEEKSRGISPAVLSLRKKVKDLMNRNNLSIDDAIDRVNDQLEKKMTAVTISRLKESLLRKTYNIAHDGMITRDGSLEAQFLSRHEPDKDLRRETEMMWEALEKANLSDIQRQLVKAYLENDHSVRRKISEEVINPGTGQLYTKQWLGVLFAQACKEMKAVYNRQANQEKIAA